MAREHLYKAKHVNWKELPKEEWWVEGNLLISDEDYYIIPDFGVSFVEKLNNFACDKLITLHAFESEKETVCQYTGLTDREGRKIFEGDILRNDYRKIGQVQWFEEHSAFMIWDDIDNKVQFLYDNNFSNIEVIGNIFDNPELIGEQP